MPKIILVAFVSLVFAGCGKRPVIHDNSAIMVVEGRGIIGICELDMTLDDIQRATGDLAVEQIFPNGEDYGGRIPSLGVQVLANPRQARIHIINFYVSDSRLKQSIPSADRRQFRGKLARGLDFGGKPITKGQIISAYGQVSIATNGVSATSSHNAGENYEWAGKHEVRLEYPLNGIGFDLVNDVVVAFHIERPVEPHTTVGTHE
jgi:hypothetical protein